MMRTANPALSGTTFAKHAQDREVEAGGAMSVQGAVYKTGMLLGILLLGAMWTWHLADEAAATQLTTEAASEAAMSAVWGYMLGGLIGGLVLAFVTIFVPRIAMVTAPLYAVAEGLLLGGLSGWLNILYPGIALPAVGCTLGVLLVMLVLYMTGILRATQRFRMGVIAATGGIFLFYIFAWISSMFGYTGAASVLAFDNGGMLSIGVSVVIVIVAALNLVLDFDLIERGAAQGAPKYMEWYAGFALLVTLVWLYIEMLRLLAKLRSD